MIKVGKLIAGIGIVGMLGGLGQAQASILLAEGFDDISTLAGSGWVQKNNSTAGGLSGWFQGNTAVFPAASGAANSYIAANFLNAPSGGAISNWLLTPEIKMSNGEELSFSLRLLGEGFLDTVSVYYSTSGSSSDVGATPSSTGVFSSLASYSSLTDTGWVDHTLTLNGLGAPATGRFAFRYEVANTNIDGNYIGIDSVSVVPEPSTLAVFALGLAMLGWHLRRGIAR